MSLIDRAVNTFVYYRALLAEHTVCRVAGHRGHPLLASYCTRCYVIR